MSARRIRVAIVINNPVAYRVPVFELVAQDTGIELKVIFSAPREPGRQTDVPRIGFRHVILKERYWTRSDGYSVHFNPDVVRELWAFGPDVIVNNGYQPTNILAFLYSVLLVKAHVPFTDGTAESEHGLSARHKLLRRVFFAASTAFIGASEGSRRLYASYGVTQRSYFKSHLCADNARFRLPERKYKYDLLFCGRLIADKRPDFAIDVAREVARRKRREVSLLIVGSGPLEAELRTQVGTIPGVRLTVHGFAHQVDLPEIYAGAKVFLFPTLRDTWGVVANEACAAGLPVIVTPHAGVAGELIRHGQNGFVHELDVHAWAESACRLLSDEREWLRCSEQSRMLVADYTYLNAASGLTAAVRHAVNQGWVRRLLTRIAVALSIPTAWVVLEYI